MLARSYVWWPRIDADIESTVSACIRCQENRHQPAKAPLHPWEWPAQPWQRVHIDFAGDQNKKEEKRERQREIFAGEWTYKEKVR